MRGYDVVVLEEHPHIGTPCHCSGLVTPRTLDVADVGADIISNAIRGALIHLPGRQPLTVGGDRVHGYVIDRTVLDRRLADQAQVAGAGVLHQTRFLSFERIPPGGIARQGELRIHATREGTPLTIRARLLVGADGARSRVAQQLRRSSPTGTVVGLGALAEYDRNPKHDHVEIFLDPHSAPGWFGWTIPLADGMARLGTGSAHGIKPRDSFRRLRHAFPATFGAARVHSYSGGLIALWQPTDMTADNVMLVGDAARQVKPMSGGGIHAALRAASMAARVADEAIQRGDLSRRSLRAYPRDWHGSLGRELRRQHDMRRVFERLTERDMVQIIELLDDGAVRDAIDEVADIDFPSRLVARVGFRQPRLALRLLRLPRFPLAWLPGG